MRVKNWKMNIPVRLKNPVFWVQLALAIGAPVFAYFGLTGADMTSWAVVWQTVCAAAQNPYVCALVLVSVGSALNDPTTPGVGDSPRALTYTRPGVVDTP